MDATCTNCGATDVETKESGCVNCAVVAQDDPNTETPDMGTPDTGMPTPEDVPAEPETPSVDPSPSEGEEPSVI